MHPPDEELEAQRRDTRRGFASLLALVVPFTPISKEGGLARRPTATLALIAINIVVHLVAWPLEKTSMPYEASALVRLAEIELGVEKRFLAARGKGPFGWTQASRLRDRNAIEETFWEQFEAGRILERGDETWQAWNRAHERWIEQKTSSPYYNWGKHPDNGNPLSWLTSFFLHFGFWHLFGNMLGLWIAGSCLEDVWGPRFLLLIYFAAGLLANVPHVLHHGDQDVIGVGASGAVAGLFGAFLVRMALQKLRFVLLPFLPTVALTGFIAFLPWAVFEIRNALSGAVTGVNHWVHVGGLAIGAAVGLGLRFAHADDRARVELAEIDRRSAQRKREKLEAEAFEHLEHHDPKGATALFVEACRAEPGAHRSFANALRRLLLEGRREEAAALAREALDALWSAGRRDEFAEAHALARDEGLAGELTSLQLLHAADALSERRPREAAETLHGLLSARPEDALAKPALSRYADLLQRLGDPAGAKAVRERLAALRPRED
jgi:membrane associated rhomboid family serine protease